MSMSRIRLAFLVVAIASLFLGGRQPRPAHPVAQASISEIRNVRARAESFVPQADSPDIVEAIVTLESESIAGMLNATRSTGKPTGKIDLESEQARSHDGLLEAQQADFISRAAEQVPG